MMPNYVSKPYKSVKESLLHPTFKTLNPTPRLVAFGKGNMEIGKCIPYKVRLFGTTTLWQCSLAYATTQVSTLHKNKEHLQHNILGNDIL